MAALAVCLVPMAQPVTAATIVDTFGPGYTFQQSGGYCVYGPSFCGAPNLSPTAYFSTTIDADLTQISLALQHSGGANSFVVSLYSSFPGGLLAQWLLTSVPTTPSVVTISGITGVTLPAANDYSLQVAPGDPSTLGVWQHSPSALGYVISPPFGPFTLLPAFEILGTPLTPVPEPASCALAGLGLGAVLLLRRK